MSHRISASSFRSLLHCPHALFLDHHGNANLKTELGEFAQYLLDEGKRFEQEILVGKDYVQPDYPEGDLDAGAKAIVDEYGAERAKSFHNFELWRLGETDDAGLLDAAREAATKFGHLSREGLITKDQALHDLCAVLSGRVDYEDLAGNIEAAFGIGRDNAGLAYLRFTAT